MLDIQFIRDNPEKVKKACQDKNLDPSVVDKLLEVDKRRRVHIKLIEEKQRKRNEFTCMIEKEKDDKKRLNLIANVQAIKSDLSSLKPKLKADEKEHGDLISQIPNLPAEDVPLGKDESENCLVKKWGRIPKLGFIPKDHLQLGESLDLIDVKRTAEVSGSRFGYLKNEAVLLEFALVQFAFDLLLKEGFTLIIPPVLIKDEMMRGMGYLEHGAEQETYHLDKDGLYLVGTSEQSIGPMYTGEVLKEKRLPKRYLGFSTCFRREAGSYGKDTKGIFRVHQFDKVEMVSFTKPRESTEEHEYLLSLEEKLVQALELPYRMVRMCTGDLGFPAASKYDIECWIPSQKKYRETHSTSNCTDFQARRLNIKYRRKDNKTDYVHILNGTAFAIGRMIIAILENYQTKEGWVKVPKVLQKYVGKEIIKSSI